MEEEGGEVPGRDPVIENNTVLGGSASSHYHIRKSYSHSGSRNHLENNFSNLSRPNPAHVSVGLRKSPVVVERTTQVKLDGANKNSKMIYFSNVDVLTSDKFEELKSRLKLLEVKPKLIVAITRS